MGDYDTIVQYKVSFVYQLYCTDTRVLTRPTVRGAGTKRRGELGRWKRWDIYNTSLTLYSYLTQFNTILKTICIIIDSFHSSQVPFLTAPKLSRPRHDPSSPPPPPPSRTLAQYFRTVLPPHTLPSHHEQYFRTVPRLDSAVTELELGGLDIITTTIFCAVLCSTVTSGPRAGCVPEGRVG